MTTPDDDKATVASASTGGNVHVGGDVVGRDKSEIHYHDSASTQSLDVYCATARHIITPIPQPIVGLPDGAKHSPSVSAVYHDSWTDAMRVGGDAERPARYSVLDILREQPLSVLIGPRNAGKSTALRFRLLEAMDNDTTSAIPILIDAVGRFGDWVTSTESLTPVDFSEWIYSAYGLTLADFRLADRPIIFGWDHLYHLAPAPQRRIVELIDSLANWFPQQSHIVTSRAFPTDALQALDGSTAATIRPTPPDECTEILSQYIEACGAAFERPLPTSDEYVGTFLAADRGSSGSVIDDYRRRMERAGLPPDAANRMAMALPRLAWRALQAQPALLTFYEVLDCLTGGIRTDGGAAEVALDTVLVADFLSDGRTGYELIDRASAVSLAALQVDRSSTAADLVSALATNPTLLDLVQALPDHGQQLVSTAALESEAVAYLRGEPRFEAVYLQLLVAVASEDDAPALRDLRQDLRAVVEARAWAETDMRLADEMVRLASRARFLDQPEQRPSIAFGPFAPASVEVSLPTGSGERRAHAAAVEYPVWLAQTPLTNEQLCALFPDPPPDWVEEICAVRPEVWMPGPRLGVRPEYALDPVVGISYFDAERICETLSQMTPTGTEVGVPTLAEWALLDKGLAPGVSVNTRGEAAQLRRPVTVGISGLNALGFGDVYGNVMEWTSSNWGSRDLDHPGHSEPYESRGVWDSQPSEPPDAYRILRGGSWLFAEDGPRCACLLPPDVRYPDVGLRPCVRGMPEEQQSGMIQWSL